MIGYYARGNGVEFLNIIHNLFVSAENGRLNIDFEPCSLEYRALLFRNEQDNVRASIENGQAISVDIPDEMLREFRDLCFSLSSKNCSEGYKKAESKAREIFEFVQDTIKHIESYPEWREETEDDGEGGECQ